MKWREGLSSHHGSVTVPAGAGARRAAGRPRRASGRVRSGVGSVVLIEGGSGLGKTRLLQPARASAEGMAFRMGCGMADPMDSVVELATLMEALFEGDSPLLDRAALATYMRRLSSGFWLQDMQALLEQAALKDPLRRSRAMHMSPEDHGTVP